MSLELVKLLAVNILDLRYWKSSQPKSQNRSRLLQPCRRKSRLLSSHLEPWLTGPMRPTRGFMICLQCGSPSWNIDGTMLLSVVVPAHSTDPLIPDLFCAKTPPDSEVCELKVLDWGEDAETPIQEPKTMMEAPEPRLSFVAPPGMSSRHLGQMVEVWFLPQYEP
jgi:hypothetical protein